MDEGQWSGRSARTLRAGTQSPLRFYHDFTGRIDPFTSRGGQASFEIHVYHKGVEWGFFGANGWFSKHGLPIPSDPPVELESVLKGYSVDWLRRAQIIKPGDDISGNKWKHPELSTGPC